MNEEQENKLYDLQATWIKNGRRAGKKETWMTPCVKEIEDYDKKTDIEIVQEDNENWEQTDHFQILYRTVMSDDIKRELGIDYGEELSEAIQTLIESFWEGYGETSDIYDMVKKERKLRKKIKVKI